MSILRALAERVLAADRIAKTPIVLKEETAGSKCDDTAVNHPGAHFSLRLRGNDHLKILRGVPGSEAGFCNLPDYLVFSEGAATKGSKQGGSILHVLVVELKSGEAGRERAVRQIQLGVSVAPYLVSLALVDDLNLTTPEIHQAGVILSPGLPPARPRTRRGAYGYEGDLDPKAGIYIYLHPLPLRGVSGDEIKRHRHPYLRPRLESARAA